MEIKMDKNLLRDVIIDQNSEPMPAALVPRNTYVDTGALIRAKQIVIVMGLRRCGKSVLTQTLRSTLPEKNYYLNFDDDRLVQFTLEDFQVMYELFVELYGEQKTFYFDEIQNILGWERFVRRLYNQGNKIFITGSNAAMLSQELGTHLTGRYLDVELYPYSFEEYLISIQAPTFNIDKMTTIDKGRVKSYFSQFKIDGGLPEYLENKSDHYLQTLYNSIIYRDIIVRHNISNHMALKELVYYLASNIGKETTYNALKKAVHLASTTTVSNYCGYLQASYLCFLVNRFDYSLKTQFLSPKKVYFIDQALAMTVGFRASADDGRILENIVFLELKRRHYEIYYHRNVKECDFLLRQSGKITHAIQVCTDMNNETTRQREIAGLIEAMETHTLSAGLIITSDDQEEITVNENGHNYLIKIIPIWRWLLESSRVTRMLSND
jgi:predicted AAA+ superfamily ATPase